MTNHSILHTNLRFYLPFIVMAATLTLWPSYNLLVEYTAYDGKRWMQIMTVTTLILSLLSTRSLRTAWLETFYAIPRWARLSLALLFALGLVSSIGAHSPRHALLELSLFSLLTILAFYLAQLFLHAPEKAGEWFLTTLVFSVTISLVLFGINWISILSHQAAPELSSLLNGFMNVRFLNQWQGIILPMVLAIVFIKADLPYRHRILLMVLGAYLWAGMFFSGGRGVVLASVVGAIATGLLFKPIRATWWKSHLVALLGGLALYGLVILSVYTATGAFLADGLGLSRIAENTTSSGRVVIWEHAWQQFLHSPILGIGPMHFAWEAYNSTTFAHPHNILLQLLTEWGLPFTLILLTVAATAFFKWVRTVSQVTDSTPPPWLAAALTNAFIAGSTHALFSGVWVMPLSQLLMTFIIGWMIGLYFHTQKTVRALPVHKQTVLFGMLAFLAALLVYGILPEASHLNDWLIESQAETGINKFSPRFWLQGFILNESP